MKQAHGQCAPDRRWSSWVECAAEGSILLREAAGKFSVVATTTIVADAWCAQIGGDDVVVVPLMGAGVDPAPVQAVRGRRAPSVVEAMRGVLQRAASRRARWARCLEQMGRAGRAVRGGGRVRRASDRLIAAGGFGGVHDPHVWFDVALWSDCGDLRPQRSWRSSTRRTRPFFATRASAVRRPAGRARCVVRRQVQPPFPRSSGCVVTAHDAFSYFGRAYGVEVRGLLGISTSSEAGTADVQASGGLHRRAPPAGGVRRDLGARALRRGVDREAVAARGHDGEDGRQPVLRRSR
jgi:manganese/zinc/iron transport system substrate-binding protein